MTTTMDTFNGDTVLLRVHREEDGVWYASDCVTTRFGRGKTLEAALANYCQDLRMLTYLKGPFGPPVAAEVEWARKVMDA
jgi:hypothetical protein